MSPFFSFQNNVSQTSVTLISPSRFLPSLQLYNFIFLRICSNSHPSVALAQAIMVTKSRGWVFISASSRCTNVSAAAAAKSLQSCPTLCDRIDGSPPGSPVPGILQARTLEWVPHLDLNPNSLPQMMSPWGIWPVSTCQTSSSCISPPHPWGSSTASFLPCCHARTFLLAMSSAAKSLQDWLLFVTEASAHKAGP